MITGILKTFANIVLPYFGIYDLLPYSSIFVLPGVVIYAYAISNFKLFSLQTALDQFRLFPITYKIALSIASVAIASFVIFQLPIVWWAFQDGVTAEGWRRYLVLQRRLGARTESFAFAPGRANNLAAVAADHRRGGAGHKRRLRD